MEGRRVVLLILVAFTATAFNRYFFHCQSQSQSYLRLKTRLHNSFKDLSSDFNNSSLARPLPTTFFTQADAEASFQAWSAEQSNSRGIIPVGPQNQNPTETSLNLKQLPTGISGALM